MSEFHDPQFEHALGRLSGEFPDDNVALNSMYQRVQQVRRRRTIVASSAATVLLIVGIGMAAARGAHDDPLQPAASISVTQPKVETSDSTTSSAPVAVVTTTKPADTTPPTMATPTTSLVVVTTGAPVKGGGSHGPGTGSNHTTVPPVTTAHTPPPTTTTVTTVTTATTATTVTPVTVAPGDPNTYSTPGGWFTVRFANGTLTLLSVHAAPGFGIDSQTVESHRIEFRFRGPGGDYRTRVEVKHGQLQVSH